ncbi:MAG TPA: DUF58 domain-containing protein [Planctomycetota bacterium]|nr:DUF58 domain-containing protein [Planctomycetota bacterium]
MIPKEILKQVRRIQILTSRMVNDVMAGEYHSTFKGRGMEFDEVREYIPGDEIRTIDWNVTARTGVPYVKKFVEERELTVMLLVDASSSGKFGSVSKTKSEVAAELCAVLAFSAIKNNDKVGLIIFTDRIEKFVPPKKGRSHVLRVIREVLYFKPEGTGTNIAGALEYLKKVTRRKSVAFLVSDFLAEDYQRPLSIANKGHDLVAVTVTDPREIELPNIGFIELEDAETGELMLIDTRDSAFREQFTGLTSRKMRERDKVFRSSGIDSIDVRTNLPYVEPLRRFFRMREKRR